MAGNKTVILIHESIEFFLNTKLYLINFLVCWARGNSSKTLIVLFSVQIEDGLSLFAHENFNKTPYWVSLLQLSQTVDAVGY